MKNIQARLFGDKFNRRYFAQNAASGILRDYKRRTKFARKFAYYRFRVWCFDRLTAVVKKSVKF